MSVVTCRQSLSSIINISSRAAVQPSRRQFQRQKIIKSCHQTSFQWWRHWTDVVHPPAVSQLSLSVVRWNGSDRRCALESQVSAGVISQDSSSR